METLEVSIRLLDDGLPLPAKAHPDDAAFDLYARTDVTLSSVTGPRTVATGIAIDVPIGFVGLVCSRSGLASSRGIAVLNAPGIIDPGYTGEVQVVLFSTRPIARVISRGTRIAQLLIQPAPAVTLTPTDVVPASTRGSRGLGSSGA